MKVTLIRMASAKWLLVDQVSSTSATSAITGAPGDTVKYSAFGEIRAGEASTDYLYTSQRKEDYIKLYWYGSRWYDDALGRFIQPDSLVPDYFNPLDWDRYSYVRNNPINNADPTGHWIESAIDIISIGYDIYDISTNGLSWENGLSLVADVASLALPVVAGGGVMVRAAFHADEIADTVRLVDKVSNSVDNVKHLQGLSQVISQADNLDETQDVAGGVYRLVDKNTGTTMRTGRTNDLIRHSAEHARNPDLADFKFETVWKTDDYAEQRGLEQILHDKYHPPLDKVNAISPRNPYINIYTNAAQRFLQGVR
jgi:RHS repeat-associated protein